MGRLGFVGVILAASAPSALAAPAYDLKLETDPVGAKVSFDDKVVCERTPCTVQRPAGAISVTIALDGYAQVFESLELPSLGRASELDVPVRIFARLVRLEAFTYARTLDEPLLADHVDADASQLELTRRETTRGPRDRVVVSGLLDIGFREFDYQHGLGALSNYSESEGGQALAGVGVEVWPAQLAHSNALPGLSVFGILELPINPTQVSLAMPPASAASGIQTDWGHYEAGARYRLAFADVVAVELGLAYVDDKMSYSGGDLSRLPDTDYSSIALRERVSLLAIEPVEPYIVLEPRYVMSIGDLESRFQATAATGYHLALGAAVRSGRFTARAEGGLTSYNLALQAMQTESGQAQAASDRVLWLSVHAGVAY